jgi:hypothetical protein
MHACIFLGYVHFMALAMVPAGSSRPIEKIVPGPLCFDAHFGAPLPPAPGAAAPPPAPPPRYATDHQNIKYAYYTRILFFENYARIFTYSIFSYAYPRTLVCTAALWGL